MAFRSSANVRFQAPGASEATGDNCSRIFWKRGVMAKFLIIEARFYEQVNDMLVAGAKAAL